MSFGNVHKQAITRRVPKPETTTSSIRRQGRGVKFQPGRLGHDQILFNIVSSSGGWEQNRRIIPEVQCCQRLWAGVNNCRYFLISRSYLDGAYRKVFLLCKSGRLLSSKMDGPRRGTLRGVIEKCHALRFVLTLLHPCPHFTVSHLSVIGLPRLLWLCLQILLCEILSLPLSLIPTCSEPLGSVFYQKGLCNWWANFPLNYLERCTSGCSSRWLPVF